MPERFLDNHGTRLWSTSHGQGIPLILCSGGPGCDDYLAPVSAMIEDICQVVRFEPRGCGRSDRDKRYDITTTIDDVEFVRQSYGFDKAIIAGHSAGVDTALAYAIRYPAHAMGIIGLAGGRVVNDREWSSIYHENLEKRGEDTGGLVFEADPDVNKIGNATWRQYIHRPTLLRELASIEAPTIFIFAGNDIRPSWPTQQLAHLLPHAQYIEIPAATHHIWRSHPAALQSHLREAINHIVTCASRP
jgi:proline iminopeptidase